MKVAKKENLKDIIEYLKTDIPNCTYMYIDISTYGLDNPNIKIWFDEDNLGINLIIMRYYDSFQLFSCSDEWDIDRTMEILMKYKLSMISGKADMIERIYKHCNDIYKAIYGSVIRIESCKELECKDEIKLATIEDIPEIARLICTDDELGKHYTVDLLIAEMSERMRTNMGRSYIIKKDGIIVAHTATYAEADNIAVASGLIVHKDYRNDFYGAILNGYMVKQLHSENREIYAFYLEDKMIKLLKAMHNSECARYGKLTKI